MLTVFLLLGIAALVLTLVHAMGKVVLGDFLLACRCNGKQKRLYGTQRRTCLFLGIAGDTSGHHIVHGMRSLWS